MFKDDYANLYAYALVLTGVILASSVFMEPPRLEVASLTHPGEDRLDSRLAGRSSAAAASDPALIDASAIETAAIETAAIETGSIETGSIRSEGIETTAIAPDLPPPPTAENWNAPSIPWRSYRDGLAEMEQTGKPGLLVIQKSDCVLCRSYQRVFHDAEILTRAGDYVFILADADDEPAVQQLYNLDGDYVPRTFVLSPDGGLRRSATSAHPKQRFFVDPHRPRVLARLLDASR